MVDSRGAPFSSFAIPAPEGGVIHIGAQVLPDARGNVLYVHGATFPSDLSVFYRLDDRSWADALNGAGYSAWGLDFVGYGRSSRHTSIDSEPLGRGDQALPQLQAAIAHVRGQDENRPWRCSPIRGGRPWPRAPRRPHPTRSTRS